LSIIENKILNIMIYYKYKKIHLLLLHYRKSRKHNPLKSNFGNNLKDGGHDPMQIKNFKNFILIQNYISFIFP